MNKYKFHDGSIVIDTRYPDKKWITHYGYYFHEDNTNFGWYKVSIPEQIIEPIDNSEISFLACIDIHSNCCKHDIEIPFLPSDKYQIDKSWISVETISDRDNLPNYAKHNGKIIRVNNTVDEEVDVFKNPKYYIYDTEVNHWKEFNLIEDINSIPIDKIEGLPNVLNNFNTSLSWLNLDERKDD